MISDLHTHSTFCDGKNTLEEMVLAAIKIGIPAIGLSGHTGFDMRYCINDIGAYIAEAQRLREKYKKEIQVYIGIEEESTNPVQRENFDYIIGSSHYVIKNGQHYSVDGSPAHFQACLAQFDNDPIKLAHAYYKPFCEYILNRKPDVVGHFDLLTKFDEVGASNFFEDPEYNRIAENYIEQASRSGCLFEVNTGAISRGYRTTPYPHENLLQVLKKNGNGIVLNSDSHSAETLAFRFSETRKWLKDVGFDYVYALYNGEFVKDYL